MNSSYKILLLSLITLGACKKNFLEIEPKGKLIAQTAADYSLLLNNLELLNIGTNAQVPMGDDVSAADPYFSSAALRTQRLFRWEANVYQPADDAVEMLVPMKNIYLYNKIILEVPDATEGTEQEKAAIKAEAQAGRAWTYFLLINYYGKPYAAGTADKDPGFPIITTADVTNNKFTRATVKEVYDFILADLTAAIPQLPNEISSRLRMSKPAAEALLGKVYMFMGRFEEALVQLKAAMQHTTNGPLAINLYDYNITFAPGGAFLPLTTRGAAFPTVPNNQEILYGKQATDFWQYNANELVLSPKTAALYASTDVRFRLYNLKAYNGAAYPNGLLRRGAATQAQIGVNLPELYLLLAEAKARTNDLPGAAADVLALRKKRMPATDAELPPAVAVQQFELLKFILDERVREYAVQGYRWFDMRRLSVDPLFAPLTFTHNIYKPDGSFQEIIMPVDRLVLRFPQKIIDQNPGMINNP